MNHKLENNYALQELERLGHTEETILRNLKKLNILPQNEDDSNIFTIFEEYCTDSGLIWKDVCKKILPTGTKESKYLLYDINYQMVVEDVFNDNEYFKNE